jgi:hypothetical protein
MQRQNWLHHGEENGEEQLDVSNVILVRLA